MWLKRDVPQLTKPPTTLVERLLEEVKAEDRKAKSLEGCSFVGEHPAMDASPPSEPAFRGRHAVDEIRLTTPEDKVTDEEKHEIATLASELERKRRIYEAHGLMNHPSDLLEAEKATIFYSIAQTEYLEASAALTRAQTRILANQT